MKIGGFFGGTVPVSEASAHEMGDFMLRGPCFTVAAHDLSLFVLPGPVLGAFAHERGKFVRERQ